MNKVIMWFKTSNRWKHLLGGLIIGMGADDIYCAAYAGIGIKTQAAQKQEEQAVQLKTKSAVFFFYDFPVQILRGEGDGTVENPGVDILKGHSALMGINQCVQSLRNKGLGIGKSNPFQILFCLFF